MSDGCIRFAYDDSTGIRIATYTGVIDDTCLLQAFRTLIVQPDFRPLAHDLADLRGAERLDLTADGLAQLGLLLSGGERRPLPAGLAGLAIVADSPASFGTARMYEMMTQGHLPKETRVFRDFDEAVAWLRSRPRLD